MELEFVGCRRSLSRGRSVSRGPASRGVQRVENLKHEKRQATRLLWRRSSSTGSAVGALQRERERVEAGAQERGLLSMAPEQQSGKNQVPLKKDQSSI